MAAISIDGTPMTALPSDADQINYDNSNSRLSDTQVQDAIDTLANDSSTFVGTTTQWDNLTTAQKKAYKYRLLTDDYTDASIGNLSALHTTDKSSVVGAVNEVKDGLSNIVKTAIITATTDLDGDSEFSLPAGGSYLVGTKPLRDANYYNAWWGIIIAASNSSNYSFKVVNDRLNPLATQPVKFMIFYV